MPLDNNAWVYVCQSVGVHGFMAFMWHVVNLFCCLQFITCSLL